MNDNYRPTDIFEIIHNRRSIRKFLDKEISDEVLKMILQAGIRAPFAGQFYSIVYTRDKEKMKLKMGVYPTTKVLMIFLIDLRKIRKIIKQKQYKYDTDDGNTVWLAIQDAILVAENIILAAEALGLGSVLLGLAPVRYQIIQQVFNLPQRVFPVVGLCIGYPDPEALMDIRPRYPLEYIAFEDEYKDLSEIAISKCMKAMDEGYITQGYYIKQRAKIPLKKELGEDNIDYDKYSWSEHLSRKLIQGWDREPFVSLLEQCGFNFRKVK
ncbi:MAG: nitroreductase family protein [Candidatus Hodarchaeales archaeon]|jgi:nitroreductase